MTDFGDGSVAAREVRGKQFNSVRGLNNWLKHHEDRPVYGVETVGEGSYALFYRPEEAEADPGDSTESSP